jgi:hypothetical protein
MSKRKQNYPDPNIVINKRCGIAYLRMYLVNSVVRARPPKFRWRVRCGQKEVFAALQRVPAFSCCKTWVMGVDGRNFVPDLDKVRSTTNATAFGSRQRRRSHQLRPPRDGRITVFTVMPPCLSLPPSSRTGIFRLNRDRLRDWKVKVRSRQGGDWPSN